MLQGGSSHPCAGQGSYITAQDVHFHICAAMILCSRDPIVHNEVRSCTLHIDLEGLLLEPAIQMRVSCGKLA